MYQLTKSRVEELLALGHIYTEIAQMFGVSRQAVCDFCKRHGLSRKAYIKDNPKAMNEKEIEKEHFMLPEEFYSVAKDKFRRKRQNCKANNIPFEIEFEDLYWTTHCPILGIELSYFSIGDVRDEGSISFDKVVPELGYTKGNVRIVSWRANRIKNDGNAEEHRKIAEYIDDHVIVNADFK